MSGDFLNTIPGNDPIYFLLAKCAFKENKPKLKLPGK